MSYRLKKRTVLFGVILLSGVGLTLGFGPGGTATATDPSVSIQNQQPGDMMSAMESSCPMMVEDASVDVADTTDGVALTFTTDRGDVSDLRRRVRHLAEMYGKHHGKGAIKWHSMSSHDQHHQGLTDENGGHDGMQSEMHPGPGKEMNHGMMPAARAVVQEVEGGARLLLVPAEASGLDSVRQHARMHCEKMKAGNCPMMQPKSE